MATQKQTVWATIIKDLSETLETCLAEVKHQGEMKNKLVQDSEGNEQNRYPDPDSNKTKINYAKKPNKVHENTLKEEILQVISENFKEVLLDNGQPKCTGGTQQFPRQQK
jgi:hypothetical protein